MSSHNKDIGKKGEELSLKFLKKSGYRILLTNYRCRIGEIDIIAENEGVLCFVEVKTRTSDSYGIPELAVDKRKQAKIIKTAEFFLTTLKDGFEREIRFDVLAVNFSQVDGKYKTGLIKNAFSVDT